MRATGDVLIGSLCPPMAADATDAALRAAAARTGGAAASLPELRAMLTRSFDDPPEGTEATGGGRLLGAIMGTRRAGIGGTGGMTGGIGRYLMGWSGDGIRRITIRSTPIGQALLLDGRPIALRTDTPLSVRADMMRRLAVRLGGQVVPLGRCASAPSGRGGVFTCTLPRMPTPPVPAPAPARR